MTSTHRKPVTASLRKTLVAQRVGVDNGSEEQIGVRSNRRFSCFIFMKNSASASLPRGARGPLHGLWLECGHVTCHG